jgi:hypothetical protein
VTPPDRADEDGTVKLVPVSVPTPRLLYRQPVQPVALGLVGSVDGLVATISQ